MSEKLDPEEVHAIMDGCFKILMDEIHKYEGWTTKYPYKKYQVRSGRLQGNIYAAQGELTEAESELLQTLKLAEQLGNPAQIWKTRQALGKLFHNQGKIDQAVEQYGSALKKFSRKGDLCGDEQLLFSPAKRY